MEFKAYKMDGLGNDFVIIDRRKNFKIAPKKKEMRIVVLQKLKKG